MYTIMMSVDSAVAVHKSNVMPHTNIHMPLHSKVEMALTLLLQFHFFTVTHIPPKRYLLTKVHQYRKPAY